MEKNMVSTYRKKLRMSQERLAESLPKHPNTMVVSLIENGHVLPNKSTMQSLCALFQCQASDLFPENELDLTGSDSVNDKQDVVFTPDEIEQIDKALPFIGLRSKEEWLHNAYAHLLIDSSIVRMSGFIASLPSS